MYYPDEQDAYRQAPLPYQPQPQQGYPPYGQPQPQQQQWYPPAVQPLQAPSYAGRNGQATRPTINQSPSRTPNQTMNQRPMQKPRTAPEGKYMPKAEALAIVDKLKRWIVIGSVVAFGTIGGLVISHTVGVTSTQAATSSSPQSAPSSSSSSQSGGFFQHTTATTAGTRAGRIRFWIEQQHSATSSIQFRRLLIVLPMPFFLYSRKQLV